MAVIYDLNGGRCWNPSCRVVHPMDRPVWLAYEVSEHHPDVAVPMHAECAAGPWPMYEAQAPGGPFRLTTRLTTTRAD